MRDDIASNRLPCDIKYRTARRCDDTQILRNAWSIRVDVQHDDIRWRAGIADGIQGNHRKGIAAIRQRAIGVGKLRHIDIHAMHTIANNLVTDYVRRIACCPAEQGVACLHLTTEHYRFRRLRIANLGNGRRRARPLEPGIIDGTDLIRIAAINDVVEILGVVDQRLLGNHNLGQRDALPIDRCRRHDTQLTAPIRRRKTQHVRVLYLTHRSQTHPSMSAECHDIKRHRLPISQPSQCHTTDQSRSSRRQLQTGFRQHTIAKP